MTQGATLLGDGRCRFAVWAPRVRRVELLLLSPEERTESLAPGPHGYHQASVDGVQEGARYRYRLDGGPKLPDPASRFQPEGVFGPSEVVGPGFPWTDDGWAGVPLSRYVLYELHVGTFTPEGTFEAAVGRLDDLAELGVTAVEVMPVAQFSGTRNWGYDGVFPFAVQHSYGGPSGMKRLVDECHRRGMAVVVDVVYNHVGPEGNVLEEFGPYVTERYVTPWGGAMNFDGPGSDQVRRYFIDNALMWFRDYHVDALRLDAIHGIIDSSAYTFLEELADAVRGMEGRRRYLIPESDLNDPRVITPMEDGGLGHDAQWSDDFHHALHALLTGERHGYYRDFGTVEHLVRAMREGFVIAGTYSSYRQRRHGRSSKDVPAERLVVYAQNHDQVGNRMRGERLSELVSFEDLKLAAGTVLVSPYLPLLFMGEEYGEPAPFLYFVSHEGPELLEAVRRGRREDFAAFEWEGDPPDPEDEQTYRRCKLDWGLAGQGHHRALRALYRELLRLRRSRPALGSPTKERLEVRSDERHLELRRRRGDDEALAVFNFGDDVLDAGMPDDGWARLLDSSEERWGGPGGSAPETAGLGERVKVQPRAFVLYGRGVR